MLQDYLGDDRRLPFGRETSEAKQQDARVRASLTKHDFSEIRVPGDQHARVFFCNRQYTVIRDDRVRFRNPNDIMTIVAEPANDRCIDVSAASSRSGT
jgi:hypothetical protein